MKLFSRLLAIAFAFALFTPAAQASGISLELAGLVPAAGGQISDYGYGSNGLYLGDSWHNAEHMYTNWTWDTVSMDIAMNGDATISGTMTRGDHSVWGLNIVLSDVQFVGSALVGATSVYDGILGDILASGENGTGLEWASLSMTLTSPYDTTVSLGGWTGFAMPDMGHYNPAELHYVDGEIRFDAWYRQAPSFTDQCGGYCYNVGDTKAVMVERPIPEPSAALVFAIGLLVTGGAIRRR
jgi:hypothetical protein